MKLIVVLLIVSFTQVSAKSYAQKVSFNKENASLKDFFNAIQLQTGYSFIVSSDLLKQAAPINIRLKNTPLREALDKSFQNQPFEYVINKKTIIINRRKNFTNNLKTVQGNEVIGKIRDEKGKPLPGVSIRLKDSPGAATSDNNGNYKIRVPNQNAVIVYSFIGFVSQEIKVSDRKNIDIVLQPQTISLDETVVIAYGTVSRQDLTGSVGTVDVEDMAKAPVTTFTQALAGRIAGLQVSSSEGQPGVMQNIVIRGPGSLTQDPSPLYIVDGFPIEDFDPSTLNTNDIESISVLKDASAAALYGSRAANGVIVIETVKGKSGKPQVILNSTFGYHQIRKKVDVMNAYEFVKYQNELNPSTAKTVYLQNGLTVEDYQSIQGINWQDRLFQTSPIQTYDFSIRGGGLYTQYALSGSLFDSEGIILNTGASRKQGRISLNHILSDKMKAGIIANYSYNQTYGAQASLASSGSSNLSNSIFYPTFGYRPISGSENIDLSDDEVDDMVTPDDPNSTRINPVKAAENAYNVRTNRSLYINAFLSYNITKDLIFKATGNIRDNTVERENFYNSSTPWGVSLPRNNRGVQANIQSGAGSSWLNENTLTYNKRLNRSHRINALVGFSVGGGKTKMYGTNIMLIPNEELGMSGIDEGTPYQTSATSSSYTIASFFGRLNYNYKSKYLLTGTFRGDGSSKFPTGNKWAYFPSGAFAWNLDREEFFKSITFVSTAKLRASYGITGNNRVNNFGYLPNLDFPIVASYSFNNDLPMKGAIPDPTGLGNNKLKWESTEQVDIGMDVEFLDKRIGLEVDVYRRTTHDMLLYADLPYATGYTRVFQNIGKLRNDGLEVSLSSKNIVKKNFRWESNFNISFNRNRVLALTRGQSEMFVNNPFHFFFTEAFNISRVGAPAGQFYGYEWIGNYQYADFDETAPDVYVLKDNVADNGSPRGDIQPGDIKYKDQNGDLRITDEDKLVIGRGLPKHFGGFNNNFSYKNFDLNVFFQWSYGNHIYNANRLIFEGNGVSLVHLNQYASYTDRWSPENQDSKNFRTGGAGPQGIQSSRVLEDGSYLRLKTVALSYHLPEQWVKRAGLSRLSLTFSAQNLLTWTKYTGFDPEVAVRNSVLTPGLDYSAYPHSKTFVAGIKAQF